MLNKNIFCAEIKLKYEFGIIFYSFTILGIILSEMKI
jgi:hypothetical protein